MTNRYARQTVLPELGADGQDRLNQASVLCVGAGGLGSPALLYLAAAGIGRIGIVDRLCANLGIELGKNWTHGRHSSFPAFFLLVPYITGFQHPCLVYTLCSAQLHSEAGVCVEHFTLVDCVHWLNDSHWCSQMESTAVQSAPSSLLALHLG